MFRWSMLPLSSGLSKKVSLRPKGNRLKAVFLPTVPDGPDRTQFPYPTLGLSDHLACIRPAEHIGVNYLVSTSDRVVTMLIA
jgi:hypothetical protein